MSIALALVLIGTGAAPSSAQDAYNPDIAPSPDGTATFQVGEEGASIHFSTLTAGNEDGSRQTICDSVTDSRCTADKVDQISANAVLKVCSSSSDMNCVVGLELAGEDGIFQSARFVRNINGMKFAANESRGFTGATTPSLWSLPTVPSASGTTDYAVIVRMETGMDWREGRFKPYGHVACGRTDRAQTGNYESP